MKKILVIDDDKDVRLLLDRFLKRQDYIVSTASSGKEGLAMLSEDVPDLILTDFKLGDINGGDLLKKVKEKHANLPVIIITGYSDIKVAINVMKNGAFDYVTKPLFPEEILNTIKKALASVDGDSDEGSEAKEPAVESEIPAKTPAKKKKRKTGNIFGTSQASKNLLNQIGLVAPTDFSVIIYGESGAGKEAVAREIHNKSGRSGKAFVAMDCGAISSELAGSELFGHEKGSFTGAITQKIGHFELANGGTLFLDEVVNLSYDVQVSLLRVVQERKLKRIGGNNEISIDVRIIVASNERLLAAAKKGKFREDLYYRFNEFEISVPALRHRDKDIMMFAEYMLDGVNEELNKDIAGFDREVVEVFKTYPWHGNIRELKNVVRRAALLCQSDEIKVDNLPYELVNHNHIHFADSENELEEARQATAPAAGQSTGEIMADLIKPTHHSRMPQDLKEAAKEAEAELIIRTLKEVNFNKSKAARVLKIDRKTLYNKIKYYNL
ncbi:sigma-54-dependent transcriptional regulator [Arcticibacterium luteifluviistationis]|uniref:Sigma-54-dependent Fis family transcriptional regulator n=1 Tax=Arcticibacterium luteifluviistationis TaxID=1784714 RepID=A0A2Z4GH97_9BACT|nr:sigma-54 dependent transcriptional regulator [Arcticibacterium luteifluviistationis]AWW00395.1 sigma-54-dependent Fis family transcriptional regulator [Arcticibacterium luteifluviistationis]